MNRIYISGPMTGLPECNYPAFIFAAEKLREQGFSVENPAENKAPRCKTWEGLMRKALAKLLKCDAIYMLPGWEHSKGARCEIDLARTLGMKVVFEKP